MSEKRYTVGLQSKTIFDMKTELYLFDNKIICELLNAQNSLICEQQATIEQQAEQIKKLSDLLFVERTNNAFDRAEKSRQTFSKEDFLKELEKWCDGDE